MFNFIRPRKKNVFRLSRIRPSELKIAITRVKVDILATTTTNNLGIVTREKGIQGDNETRSITLRKRTVLMATTATLPVLSMGRSILGSVEQDKIAVICVARKATIPRIAIPTPRTSRTKTSRGLKGISSTRHR